MIDPYLLALADYAVDNQLIRPEDHTFVINRLLAALKMDSYTPSKPADADLEHILARLCDYAYENGIIPENSVVYRDLFDTHLMGLLTPFPSQVQDTFWMLYAKDPVLATDYYYKLSQATDYIRTYRVKKDWKWKVETPYGTMDITVNLSKPEKDPKAIAAAKSLPQSAYPKCALCMENEGYAGRLNAAPRQNHRIIPLNMAGRDWFLQYSPYVYYNEHCIAFSREHTPMKIDRSSFEKILSFVELFPHYFIGSNADLPIVGGSILTHDHMQGGRYDFAMAKGPIEMPVALSGFEDLECGIVKWPMSVVRITGAHKERLVELADRILCAWREYSDEKAFVFSHTNTEPHNTVTPIGRMVEGRYQLDLVLRNNITTPEYPMGVYHPHPELHNIKKENIGLIEVMGLAVLPARLKKEMEQVRDAILSGQDLTSVSDIAKHAQWVASFSSKYTFTPENTMEILEQEIGKTFVRVLEHAGVYPCTPDGREAFMRFLKVVCR